MQEIRWKDDLKSALWDAKSTNRLIFMFFHHPECGGCIKTRAITFSDRHLADVLSNEYVPIQFLVTKDQEVTARYKIEWTPTLILADEYGNELERWVGFLPAEEFMGQLYLSKGLAEFHRNRFRAAESAFEWIIDHQPESEVAPEARYYMGVALYKESGDPSHLARTWESMSRRYPGNYWTKKASAWS
ncbi:MAG: thioredoxin fold domain-containing protein [Deltaproteobacteria bacterium]|nr:thioredoxin fold domain-containing protein [Deltaproteobacteria bacterium]